MLLTQALLGRITKKVAASDQTWQQYIEMICAMLCISDRKITIDSARPVVHIHFTQLGRQHLLDIPFKDIIAAVNGPAKTAPGDSRQPRVTSPGTVRSSSSTPATSPP
jgi:hypothetical protein